MQKIKGKRFIFGIIAIICVTGASCYLKYDGEVYIKLVGLIVGLFMAAQTITDYKNGGGVQ